MDNRFPQMLYRAGSALEIDGSRFDTLLVSDESALSAALAEGWHETTGAALEALHVQPVPDDDAPPTRDELLQKAAELGLKVDKRWSDARLAAAINEKLEASA
jgi:hypothetical protein